MSAHNALSVYDTGLTGIGTHRDMRNRMETREKLADFAEHVLLVLESSPDSLRDKLQIIINSAFNRDLAAPNGGGHFRRLDR